MSTPVMGQLRGLRLKVVGENDWDESGLDFTYVFVPEEGSPAVWNGVSWIELTKEISCEQ
jgi:hypothetical protein